MPSGSIHNYYLADDSMPQKSKWEIDPRLFVMPATLQQRLDPLARKRPNENELTVAPKKTPPYVAPCF